MIEKDLLTAKGTIEGILALGSTGNEVYELETIAGEMDVASSTARDRLESLEDEGLVEQSAELVDDVPTRVFTLTEDGEALSNNLQEILTQEN